MGDCIELQSRSARGDRAVLGALVDQITRMEVHHISMGIPTNLYADLSSRGWKFTHTFHLSQLMALFDTILLDQALQNKGVLILHGLAPLFLTQQVLIKPCTYYFCSYDIYHRTVVTSILAILLRLWHLRN